MLRNGQLHHGENLFALLHTQFHFAEQPKRKDRRVELECTIIVLFKYSNVMTKEAKTSLKRPYASKWCIVIRGLLMAPLMAQVPDGIEKLLVAVPLLI